MEGGEIPLKDVPFDLVAESSVWKWDIIRETLGALVSPNHDLL